MGNVQLQVTVLVGKFKQNADFSLLPPRPVASLSRVSECLSST